jgi:hypothetical protein
VRDCETARKASAKAIWWPSRRREKWNLRSFETSTASQKWTFPLIGHEAGLDSRSQNAE